MGRGLTIVGLGEALFDVFPDRQILGGAPLNVAVHAHQLASTLGGRGIPVSRIGRDELGSRLVEGLSSRGIPTVGLQVDDERPTGRVLVTFLEGEPHYEIVPDAAWDRIEFTEEARELAEECDAVCFGSLGQRSPQSREAIGQFLRHAPRAIRLFDVNLRQEFFSEEMLRPSCTLATVVKLNDQELPRVHRLLFTGTRVDDPSSQVAELREYFALDAVVLTRGSAGTVLCTVEGLTEGRPAAYPLAPGADSVGAGDACAAGVAIGMLLRWPAERIVSLANDAGAYVASQPGATPQLPPAILRRVTRETGGS